MEKKEFKKKFNLDKEMIQVEYNNKVETTSPALNLVKKRSSSEKVHLTLSVPGEFVPDFKSWCIKHNTTMSKAVVEGLNLLKQKNGY